MTNEQKRPGGNDPADGDAERADGAFSNTDAAPLASETTTASAAEPERDRFRRGFLASVLSRVHQPRTAGQRPADLLAQAQENFASMQVPEASAAAQSGVLPGSAPGKAGTETQADESTGSPLNNFDEVEPGTRFGAPGPRMSARNPIYLGFMGTVGVGFALLLYYVMTNVGQLLAWIAAALFIALGLDPVVRWLEQRSIPRPAGIVVSLLLLGGVIAAFFATLIPTIVTQTTQFIEGAPGYIDQFLNSPFFLSVDQQFEIRTRIISEVNNFFADSAALGGIFGGVVGIGRVIADVLFGILIVLVLTLYFLSSLPAMKRWAYRLAPRSRRKRVELLSEAITRSIGNYVIGQACVALLNATYAFIVMSIVGVPFAVLLGFVVALLAFIPLIGGVIAGIVVSLVALTAGWQTAVVFAIFYFAYLQFEAYFVSPRVMHKAVAVPGAVAVIAVIAGGSLMGVLGALMAIPTAAAIILLLQELYIARQDRH